MGAGAVPDSKGAGTDAGADAGAAPRKIKYAGANAGAALK